MARGEAAGHDESHGIFESLGGNGMFPETTGLDHRASGFGFDEAGQCSAYPLKERLLEILWLRPVVSAS